MGSNFERHLINQRMTTSLNMSPSSIALLMRLLVRVVPDPLVANKRTCNRLTQEDTKLSIRRAFGQTLGGHDRQEGEIREFLLPTLSAAPFHGSSSHLTERLKSSGLNLLSLRLPLHGPPGSWAVTHWDWMAGVGVKCDGSD